jgi:hypothetical protein
MGRSEVRVETRWMKRVAKVSMRSDVLGSRDLRVKVEFRQHLNQLHLTYQFILTRPRASSFPRAVPLARETILPTISPVLLQTSRLPLRISSTPIDDDDARGLIVGVSESCSDGMRTRSSSIELARCSQRSDIHNDKISSWRL